MEEDTQFAPSDQIQRFPASLMSHTSYNPMLMLQHEPTELTYTLPPGVEYAAMNRLPAEWANFSVYEQRMRRYDFERRLRNPPHITQGLDLKYWEARAEYPLLVPRRQDFRTYDDYVHASRDFSMELHRLQMRARAARARDHPKVRHYLESIFKDNIFEKASQIVGLGAAMAGYPFLGAGLGLAGPMTQHQFDHATLKQKLKASKRLLKNPHNLYFEKRSGEWLTLTLPKEADLDDTNSLWKYGIDEPVGLLRSVAELEEHHGVVESRHKRFEREMRTLGQNYRLMMQMKKADIAQKTAKTIVFNVVKNVVALADFAEHMTQMQAVVGDTFISEENRRMLAVGYQLLNGVAETGDVWTEMSRAMDIDDVQTEMLRQDMNFPDAVAYMAKQTIRDVKEMEKLGKVSLKIDSQDALMFKKLGSLAQRDLKPESIDTLQAAKIIPDGSVTGAISNYEKAQALGAREAMLRKMAGKPDTPVYEKQADMLTAAKIDAMRHFNGPVPTRHTVVRKMVNRPVNLPDLIQGYRDVLKKEDLSPKKRAGMKKRLRTLRRTQRDMQARTRQQARRPRKRAQVRFAKPGKLDRRVRFDRNQAPIRDGLMQEDIRTDQMSQRRETPPAPAPDPPPESPGPEGPEEQAENMRREMDELNKRQQEIMRKDRQEREKREKDEMRDLERFLKQQQKVSDEFWNNQLDEMEDNFPPDEPDISLDPVPPKAKPPKPTPGGDDFVDPAPFNNYDSDMSSINPYEPIPDPPPPPPDFEPDPDPDPDPDDGFGPPFDPDDPADQMRAADERNQWSYYTAVGVAGVAIAAEQVNERLEPFGTFGYAFKKLFGVDPKPETRKFTIDDYVQKFDRNVTNAFPFAWMANAKAADGIGDGRNRPATYEQFVRDSEFDGFSQVVYFDEKSKTVWMGVAGNRLDEEVRNPGQTGMSFYQNADEAARLFQLGLYTKDAILEAPRYLQMKAAIERLIEKYDKYTHIKLTGHSTGSTMILQFLRNNPRANARITWSTLFNMPMVNGKEQQKDFQTFLNRSPQVCLMGVEFDQIDPGHRLYINGRDYVLGYLTNPQLNATLANYEWYKKSNPLLWGTDVGHSLKASAGFASRWIDPATPMRYFDYDEIIDPLVPGDEFYMEPPTAWETVQETSAGFAKQTNEALNAAYEYILPKEDNPNEFTFEELTTEGFKRQSGEWLQKDERGDYYGFVPTQVQYGGESGMGEGEKFEIFVYKPSMSDETYQWGLPQYARSFGLQLELIQPWMTKPIPEELQSTQEIQDWLRKIPLRGKKRMILNALVGLPKSSFNIAGRPNTILEIKGPYQGITEDRIRMALYQIDDTDLLREILREVSVYYDLNGKVIKGGYGTGPSSWNNPVYQFVSTDPNTGHKLQQLRTVDRVFYKAALKYVEKLRSDWKMPRRREKPGMMETIIDSAEKIGEATMDTVKDSANMWYKMSKVAANSMINSTVGAALGYFLFKATGQQNIRDLADAPFQNNLGALNGIIPQANMAAITQIAAMNDNVLQHRRGNFFQPNMMFGDAQVNVAALLGQLSLVNPRNAMTLYESIQNLLQAGYPQHVGGEDIQWAMQRAQQIGNSHIDMSRPLSDLINAFLSANLPQQAMDWAQYGAAAGTIATTSGTLPEFDTFDINKPLFEPSITRKLKKEEAEKEARKERDQKRFNLRDPTASAEELERMRIRDELPNPAAMKATLEKIKKANPTIPGLQTWTVGNLQDWLIKVKQVGLENMAAMAPNTGNVGSALATIVLAGAANYFTNGFQGFFREPVGMAGINVPGAEFVNEFGVAVPVAAGMAAANFAGQALPALDGFNPAGALPIGDNLAMIGGAAAAAAVAGGGAAAGLGAAVQNAAAPVIAAANAGGVAGTAAILAPIFIGAGLAFGAYGYYSNRQKAAIKMIADAEAGIRPDMRPPKPEPPEPPRRTMRPPGYEPDKSMKQKFADQVRKQGYSYVTGAQTLMGEVGALAGAEIGEAYGGNFGRAAGQVFGRKVGRTLAGDQIKRFMKLQDKEPLKPAYDPENPVRNEDVLRMGPGKPELPSWSQRLDQRQDMGPERKPYDEQAVGGIEQFSREILSTSGASAINYAASQYIGGSGAVAGGAIGSLSGMPEAGATIGSFAAKALFATGAKKYMNYLLSTNTTEITTGQRSVLNNLVQQDNNNQGGVALAMAAGALAQLAYNVNMAPNQDAWRGASSERLQLLSQMTEAQRTLFRSAMAANPTFRGEMTVEGSPLGSWQTYLMKMILINEDYARRTLEPIINSSNLDPDHNQRAWRVVADFWNGIEPDNFRNVFLTALASGLSVYGAKKLYEWLKPSSKPKPKQKKKKSKNIKVKEKGKRMRMRKRLSGRSKPAGGRRPDSLLALFKRLDKDKSGRLTVNELGRLARRFKMDAPSLMRRIDRDSNGSINFAEFAQFMRARTSAI